MTGLPLGWSRNFVSISGRGKKFFSRFWKAQTCCSHAAFYVMVTEDKGAGASHHSHPSSAVAKFAYCPTSSPPDAFVMLCLVKHRGKFTFTVHSSSISTYYCCYRWQRKKWRQNYYMHGFSVFKQWVFSDFCANLYTHVEAVGALFIFRGTDRELWICPWSRRIRSRFSWRKVIRSAQVFVLPCLHCVLIYQHAMDGFKQRNGNRYTNYPLHWNTSSSQWSVHSDT